MVILWQVGLWYRAQIADVPKLKPMHLRTKSSMPNGRVIGLIGILLALIASKYFYMASLSQLLQLISELGDEATHLLVVGHNPGLSELAQHYQLTHGGLDTGQLCSAELPLANWQSL